jgi:hypothetical protein
MIDCEMFEIDSHQQTLLHPDTISIRVRNVDPSTPESEFAWALRRAKQPKSIKCTPPTYRRTESEAEEIVKRMLYREGMVSWELLPPTRGAVREASGMFLTRKDAINALRKLHNAQLPELGNSKLVLRLKPGARSSVPSKVCKAIKQDLGSLEKKLREGSTYVQLTLFPEAPPSVDHTLQISGYHKKDVTRTIYDAMKILVGTVAELNGSVMWHPVFYFPEGVAYLDKVSQQNGVYIHRNLQKPCISIHGGKDATKKALAAVTMRYLEWSGTKHTIRIHPDLSQKVLNSWKAVQEKFGQRAALDVTQQPPSMSIYGSQNDLQVARELLKIRRNSISCDIRHRSIPWPPKTPSVFSDIKASDPPPPTLPSRAARAFTHRDCTAGVVGRALHSGGYRTASRLKKDDIFRDFSSGLPPMEELKLGCDHVECSICDTHDCLFCEDTFQAGRDCLWEHECQIWGVV